MADHRPFTAADTLGTLEHACAQAGLNAVGAELVRLGENAIYRLSDPIIARIARTAAYASDAQKELRVARWLEAEQFPAVRALPLDQPFVTDGRVVTFWESVSDEESYGSTTEVAELLTRLHGMTTPPELKLEPLRPFARAERRIETNGWLTPQDRSYLRQQLDQLQEQYAGLEFALRAGTVHGDANVGNVIHDRAGAPVLMDLDGFAIGPLEWDLVLTAIYFDSFGWHTREEYEAFAEVYGFDIMQWTGYPVLRDVREFLMVTWLSQKAHDSEKVAAEVRNRIAALRTGADKHDWQPY
jgi:aminoglycoside phosphotransferase (APT) family kinase protein